jgi:hypothetical protein
MSAERLAGATSQGIGGLPPQWATTLNSMRRFFARLASGIAVARRLDPRGRHAMLREKAENGASPLLRQQPIGFFAADRIGVAGDFDPCRRAAVRDVGHALEHGLARPVELGRSRS